MAGVAVTQTLNGNHCRTIEELTTRTETSAVARATPVRIGEGWLGLPFDADGYDPQGIALSGQVSLTYDEVDASLDQMQGMLARRGIRPGDVVSLQFRDELLHALHLMAVGRSGATAFGIPKTATSMQRIRMMQEVGSSLVLGDNPDEASEIGYVFVTMPPDGPANPCPVVAECAPHGAWLIINSSGSTGKPKLIPVDHQTLRNRLQLYIDALGKSRQDRVASLSSLDLPSTKNQMLSTLFAGGAYMFKTSESQALGTFLREERITVLYTTPAHLHQLLMVSPKDMKTLRAVVAAGAPIGAGLRHKFREAFGDILFVRYGTSESGPISDAAPADAVRIDGTVGKAINGVQIDILSADGTPMPPNAPGRICVRSPGLFGGYVGQAPAITKEDGFITGDIGFLTVDGHLVHQGREDDMMIMNGVNIYPAELEQTLSEHPAIAAVIVRPMRHDILDAVPVAFVQLMPGSQISEREVLHFCQVRLGARAARHVIILDRIPRNESGKPDRAVLDSLLAGVGR